MSKKYKRKKKRLEGDIAQFGPVELRRSRKRVSFRNTIGPLSPKQHAEYEKEIQQRMVDALSAFDKETAEIELLLSKYDPFTIIALMILRESVVDPETYKEYSFQGQPYKLEHIALLSAKQPYPKNLTSEIDVSEINRILEYADQITMLLFPRYDRDGRGQKNVEILAWFAGVRMPAYEHQYVAMLAELFDPFDAALSSSIGFSSRDIIAIEQKYSEIANELINGVLSVVADDARALGEVVTGGPVPENVPREFIDGLRSLPPGDREAFLQNAHALYSATTLGRALAMTSEDIASATGLSSAAVKSALSRFSIRFGDVPATYGFPEPYSMLQQHPFLEHDDHFLQANVALLLPAIQPMLEHAMNPARSTTGNAELWNAYTEHRKALSENKTLEYLKRALRGARVYGDVKYRGAGFDGELDGLILFDRTLLFVEVKAGAFSPQAKSGDPDAFLGDVNKLINEAHRQAQRAMDYYNATPQPVFRLPDKSQLDIDKGVFDRTVLVTVTMEQLGILTADFNRLPARDPSRTLPWGLSLWDLDIVTQLVGNGAELVDYLLRRTSIMDRIHQISAADELDWLGRYFHDSLEFADLRDESKQYTNISISSGSTEMDSYFMYLQGVRQGPAEKPRHTLEPIIRTIIDELQRIAKPGWSEAALVLLSLPHKMARSFRKQAEKARNRKIGRTLLLDYAPDGLHIVCTYESSLSELESSANTRLMCRMRDDNSVAEVRLERSGYDPVQFSG